MGVSAAEPPPVPHVQRRHISSVVDDVAAVGRQHARDEIAECTFPRTIRSEDADYLALGHIQLEVFDDSKNAGLARHSPYPEDSRAVALYAIVIMHNATRFICRALASFWPRREYLSRSCYRRSPNRPGISCPSAIGRSREAYGRCWGRGLS